MLFRLFLLLIISLLLFLLQVIPHVNVRAVPTPECSGHHGWHSTDCQSEARREQQTDPDVPHLPDADLQTVGQHSRRTVAQVIMTSNTGYLTLQHNAEQKQKPVAPQQGCADAERCQQRHRRGRQRWRQGNSSKTLDVHRCAVARGRGARCHGRTAPRQGERCRCSALRSETARPPAPERPTGAKSSVLPPSSQTGNPVLHPPAPALIRQADWPVSPGSPYTSERCAAMPAGPWL